MAINLFGENIEPKELIRDKFIEPPFSILDSHRGEWQNRKRRWAKLGMKSEEGREKTFGSMRNFVKYASANASYKDTSIFDPVLTEIIYHWFCPKGGTILDCFAGGSVRGIVANYLGYKYTGIELRPEQVESNRSQAKEIIPEKEPIWHCGDSDDVLEQITGQFDLVFSCPPYADLEVYSDLPTDLSNMEYKDFLVKYASIIKKTYPLVKYGGYAIFVVGEVRDKKGNFYGFVPDTIRLFLEAGYKYYNEMIMREGGLSTAAMRCDKQFSANKKIVKIHQNILCFKKV
jgi:DNA modification methylase